MDKIDQILEKCGLREEVELNLLSANGRCHVGTGEEPRKEGQGLF
mgnify:CR=1 FL=1